MSKKKSRSGHGGRRKIGRNKIKCAAYRLAGRREKNKVRKLTKYLKKHPNDKVARRALVRYQK